VRKERNSKLIDQTLSWCMTAAFTLAGIVPVILQVTNRLVKDSTGNCEGSLYITYTKVSSSNKMHKTILKIKTNK